MSAIDPDYYSDPKNAGSIIAQSAITTELNRNDLANATTATVQVMAAPATVLESEDMTERRIEFYGLPLQIDNKEVDIKKLWPKLCTPDFANDPAIMEYIATLPLFESTQKIATDVNIGDVVQVTLAPNHNGKTFSLAGGYFNGLLHKNDALDILVNVNNCKSLQDLDWEEVAMSANSKEKKDIEEVKSKGTYPPINKQIVSQMSQLWKNYIVAMTTAEIEFWNGKKEFAAGTSRSEANSDSPEYKKFLAYWIQTFISSGTRKDKSFDQINKESKVNVFWSSGGVAHWSAVYITYIMHVAAVNAANGGAVADNFNWYDQTNDKIKKAQGMFNGQSAHHYYMVGSMALNPKWKVYRLDARESGSGKVKAEVGDILITVYKDPNRIRELPNSHGDIVWKIDGNKAYLTGGNISNTAINDREVTLDGNGNYSNNEQDNRPVRNSRRNKNAYYVAMKYNAKEVALTT
tara:strand:+ start:67 stop:1455 length:1389 start_codon:yes stop_codon:yes gene_type:complete